MRIKDQKGISLITLVVTIVLLLIIAGTTASMLFDADGFFKKSAESKRLQENYANSEETKTNELINEVDKIKESYNEPEQKEYTFNYTGAVQEWTAPASGKYKLEVWGAQGGSGSDNSGSIDLGGLGGYSTGIVYLEKNTNIYIYVGQKGIDSLGNKTTGIASSGGFNGGANGGTKNNSSSSSNGGGGGGASDIRINQDSLYARIIVAGAGGGRGYTTESTGGIGGGTTGGSSIYKSVENGGTGGTQIAGGSCTSTYTGTKGENGSLGLGGTGGTSSSGAGGGGGRWWLVWWPEAEIPETEILVKVGGGGSGWVYTEEAYTNWAANSVEGKSGEWKLDEKYYLTDAQTIAGSESFKSPSGETETGHSGNGYAKITWVGK